MMELVIVESPFVGNFEKNIYYARLCILDCLQRGEAPFASHLLYPQCLNDERPADRTLGMNAGAAWALAATKRIFYIDLGMSPGMKIAKKAAKKLNQIIEIRRLPVLSMAKLDQIGWNATKGFK